VASDTSGAAAAYGLQMALFDGFEAFDLATTGTTTHGRRGGDGPPVLLLHGIPQTQLMWHRVAPRLAERFTVVATDLRGFGGSGTPDSTPDHAPYGMRSMALDHPGTVTKLAVLDVVPAFLTA
jgi:haloacetate dehalogenase